MKYIVAVAGEHFEVEFRGQTMLVDGQPVEASLVVDGAGNLRRLFIADSGAIAEVERVVGGWLVQLNGAHREVRVVDERVQRLRERTGLGSGPSASEVLRAPMPGMVLRLQVEVGQVVAVGDGVLVLEAMKMENEIRASVGGVVAVIHAEAGTAVEKGAPLVAIGPSDASS